jgi:hypothetical protein
MGIRKGPAEGEESRRKFLGPESSLPNLRGRKKPPVKGGFSNFVRARRTGRTRFCGFGCFGGAGYLVMGPLPPPALTFVLIFMALSFHLLDFVSFVCFAGIGYFWIGPLPPPAFTCVLIFIAVLLSLRHGHNPAVLGKSPWRWSEAV